MREGGLQFGFGDAEADREAGGQLGEVESCATVAVGEGGYVGDEFCVDGRGGGLVECTFSIQSSIQDLPYVFVCRFCRM